jgi:hypothetical protein
VHRSAAPSTRGLHEAQYGTDRGQKNHAVDDSCHDTVTYVKRLPGVGGKRRNERHREDTDNDPHPSSYIHPAASLSGTMICTLRVRAVVQC